MSRATSPAASRPDLARVSVVGPSGAGKSTLAAALGSRVGSPGLELDGVVHQADWRPLPRGELRARVEQVTATDRWVIDGNYDEVRDLVWRRATAVVWLDLPRAVSTTRVVRRTVRRAVCREQLWNGNRERPTVALKVWDDESVIGWAWRSHPVRRRDFEVQLAEPWTSHLAVIRLRSSREVRRWLAALVG